MTYTYQCINPFYFNENILKSLNEVDKYQFTNFFILFSFSLIISLF